MTKRVESQKKRGRPSDFSLEMAEKVYSLAADGATDTEMAKALGVHFTTLYRWRKEHEEFCKATEMGKELADQRVERALYQRSLGYSHAAVKIFMPAGADAPVYAEYTEHYPPDTTAASLWLRNRQPDKWRDKLDHELTGKDGAPLIPAVYVGTAAPKE